MKKNKKIAVLVSGGVDSSLALKLLKDQGYQVTVFYLKIWLEDELSFLGSCPWQDDLEVVQKVCKQLNVPLEVVSLQRAYWDRVVQYTIAQVREGRTPNPDVLCNQQVKFGAFFEKIAGKGYDAIATGHYAQVRYASDGVACLVRAPDAVKDQTYFLSQLKQEQLSRLLFPIGHLTKQEVRELASLYNLPNKDRKDSQGICFLGKISFPEFLRYHLGEREGSLIEFETGTVVGSHKGFWFYTRGQRQGIGLSGGPWYVVDKDPNANIVYISRNYFSTDKKRNTFSIAACNWLNGKKPQDGQYVVKLRHGPQEYSAQLNMHSESSGKITLDGNDQGIAPGQFAVVYKDEECLGSGVIC